MMILFFDGTYFIATIIAVSCFIKKSSLEVNIGPSKMKNALKKSGIVPDILSVFPKDILQIEYENRKEVAFGNNMSRWDTIEDPVRISYPSDPKSYYTIIMTDPDCPSRENPSHREWQHWVLVNIPGASWTQGFYLTDYIGILGQYEYAVHRYVFIIYKQPGNLNFTERVLDARPIEALRYKFSTRKFAEKYKFGDPVAVNFFMSGKVQKHSPTTSTSTTKTTAAATTATSPTIISSTTPVTSQSPHKGRIAGVTSDILKATTSTTTTTTTPVTAMRSTTIISSTITAAPASSTTTKSQMPGWFNHIFSH